MTLPKDYFDKLSSEERAVLASCKIPLTIKEILDMADQKFSDLINANHDELSDDDHNSWLKLSYEIKSGIKAIKDKRNEIRSILKEDPSRIVEKSKHNELYGSNTGNGNGSQTDEPVVTIEDATEYILSQYSFATLKEDDTIHAYKDGQFVPDGEIVIKQELEREFGYKVNRNKRAEIREHIRNKTYKSIEDFDSDLNLINLKNGLYDIKTDKLLPHSPDYLSSNQQPITYDARAPVPRRFIEFLKGVIYPGDLWTLIELMAYTFLRDNPFEIITILLGNGSNGKSVVFGILTALHGVRNVSNVSLKTMVDRPFGPYDLVGKDCNLDAEMSSGIIKDTALLKKITGRQLIRVEQKNQKAFDARIYAKLWLNCNSLPQINPDDQNDAYYRRNIIVGFPNKFEERDYIPNCEACKWQEAEDKSQNIFKLDPDLISKLTTPEELSGIFNLLMYAIRKILNNKRISVSDKTIEQRKQKYELAVNPVAVFLKLAVKPDSQVNDAAPKELVYSAYKQFCKFYRLSVMSKTMLSKALKRQGIQDGHARDDRNKDVRVWWSISLTQDYLKAVSLERVKDTLDAYGPYGV